MTSFFCAKGNYYMNQEIKKIENEKSEKGASLVEYALLVALIVVVCIVGITTIGAGASKAFSSTGSAMVVN